MGLDTQQRSQLKKAKNLGTCQFTGCNRKAEFGVYRMAEQPKRWFWVCESHEREIAKENLAVGLRYQAARQMLSRVRRLRSERGM